MRTTTGVSALIALLVCLAVAATAAAAPPRVISDPSATPSWTLQINGSGTSADGAGAVVADRGGAYVAGYATNAAGNLDATLARVSSTGVRQWLKRYDGPAHNDDDIAKLAKGPGGTLYGVGYSVNAAGKRDLLVVKWSSGGRRLWVRRYDGALHGWDAATAVGVDKYGNVTVAGYSEGSGSWDWVVAKWSAKGVKRWVWRRDGSAHSMDLAADLLVTSGGTSYVTGYIQVTGPRTAALTVKLSPTGRRLWSRTFLGTSGLGAAARSIARRPAGGVYVAGYADNAVTGRDGLVMRYSAAGTGTPLPLDAGVGDQAFNDVTVTTNRSVVAVGTDDALGSLNGRVMLYPSESSPGVGLSTGGAFEDAFTHVASDAFNGYYMTGLWGAAGGMQQIMTHRLSAVPGGGRFTSLWGPALGVDGGYGIAVSGTTAYVVGRTYAGPAEGYNQVVLAYIY